MFALIMSRCWCQTQLHVAGLFETFEPTGYEHGCEGATSVVLGIYPTRPLAEGVRKRVQGLDLGFRDTIEYMRQRAPRLRMTRGEVRRTRAIIARALEIINDEGERRRLMPFTPSSKAQSSGHAV